MTDVTEPAPAPAPQGGFIAEYFKFAERGTDLVKEAKAGLTTFMVMAYILFVNPSILSNMFAPGSPDPAIRSSLRFAFCRSDAAIEEAARRLRGVRG